MRPCQKKHALRKIESYQATIDKINITVKEQQKRVQCFQGLINQLRAVINDTEDD
jgi:peptidoglycan hydrolase CwlO-like protein